MLQRLIIQGEERYIDERAIAFACDQSDDVCPDCRRQSLNSGKCRQIRQTYRESEGNIAVTARLLGVLRTTIYKHLRATGVDIRSG